QLLGRALGFGTFKLPFGHRGINVPVMDRTTQKVEITSQNHGFAVDAPLEGETTAPFKADYGRVVVSHVCLNDDVVEGLACLDIRPSPSSSTPRPRPARTIRAICSIASSTSCPLPGPTRPPRPKERDHPCH